MDCPRGEHVPPGCSLHGVSQSSTSKSDSYLNLLYFLVFFAFKICSTDSPSVCPGHKVVGGVKVLYEGGIMV